MDAFNARPLGNLNRASSKLHHHLGELEMVGFQGEMVGFQVFTLDIELILCLARFRALLEKVILHPVELNCFVQNIQASSRERAKLLGNQLPARVQLEIL